MPTINLGDVKPYNIRGISLPIDGEVKRAILIGIIKNSILL